VVEMELVISISSFTIVIALCGITLAISDLNKTMKKYKEK
jgi:hypothetical protein